MTGRQFRIISRIIAVILILAGVFIFWLSKEAVQETENWNFFDFDFKNREGVISSYGSLLAAILSFIAILLVLLDLFYQRRLKSIEDEEQNEALLQDYRDHLNIIFLFVSQLYKDVLSQNDSALKFVGKEKKNPTEVNFMTSLPNTYPKLILGVDKVRFFDAIQHHKPSGEWEKLYVDLYQITDFYDKSFDEIKQKHQINLDKKFNHCRELAIAMDELIDLNSAKRNKMIFDYKERGEDATENPFFEVLHFIKDKAVEIVSRRVNPEDRLKEDYVNPTSFTVWHEEVWQPAFDRILELWNEYGLDSYNISELLNKIQKQIRQYHLLIQDTEDYYNHVQEYFQSYYSEKSDYVKRLEEIKTSIDSSLKSE